MALTTCTVSMTVYGQDGAALPNARVKFELSRDDRDSSFVAPETKYVEADANGDLTVDLWPNDRGDKSSHYKVTVYDMDNRRQWETRLKVPDESTADFHEYELDEKINVTPTAAQAAVTKAEEWAENPEDDEVETGQYSALHHAAKAEDWAKAAMANGDVYDNTTDGLAATTDGDYFIALVSGNLKLYRNDSGSATEVFEYLSAANVGTAAAKDLASDGGPVTERGHENEWQAPQRFDLIGVLMSFSPFSGGRNARLQASPIGDFSFGLGWDSEVTHVLQNRLSGSAAAENLYGFIWTRFDSSNSLALDATRGAAFGNPAGGFPGGNGEVNAERLQVEGGDVWHPGNTIVDSNGFIKEA